MKTSLSTSKNKDKKISGNKKKSAKKNRNWIYSIAVLHRFAGGWLVLEQMISHVNKGTKKQIAINMIFINIGSKFSVSSIMKSKHFGML